MPPRPLKKPCCATVPSQEDDDSPRLPPRPLKKPGCATVSSEESDSPRYLDEVDKTEILASYSKIMLKILDFHARGILSTL